MHKFIHYIDSHKMIMAGVLAVAILLCVPFPAFHSSILGKSVLISLIIGISYCNKVAGILAVIFLVLLFQSEGGRYYPQSMYAEGFTGSAVVTDASGNTKTVQLDGSKAAAAAAAPHHKSLTFDISGNIDILKTAMSQVTGTTTPTATTDATTATATPATTTTTSVEGFDLLGTEDTLRKGKQSNTIATKKDYAAADRAYAPFENSKYIENFMIL